MTRPIPLSVSLTVVISTLDRPVQLARCLDALLAGTCMPAEIVVVDQGDISITAQIISARPARGVEVVHVPHHGKGLSASQNAGVRRARSSAVAIVDDDCVPDARWVEVAASEHARSERPLLVTGRVLPLPSAADRIVPLSTRSSRTRHLLPPDAMPWEVGTGGNFSVTRIAYLDIGGNDERLGAGASGRAGNDLDLFHRLLGAGVEARYEPALVVLHERATAAEYRGRRWTYGFGVGACVAVWLAERDPRALRILIKWILMRGRRMAVDPTAAGIANEARILLGTGHGLWHGWRLGSRPPLDDPHD